MEKSYVALSPGRYMTRRINKLLILLPICITACLLMFYISKNLFNIHYIPLSTCISRYALPRAKYSANGLLNGIYNLTKYKIKTVRGEMNLAEANENVFIPLGYEIVEPTLPVPKLKFLKEEPTCETTFKEWIEISTQPQPQYPPKAIPTDLICSFLLNGYTAVQYEYRNDKNNSLGQIPEGWDRISERIKKEPKDIAIYGIAGISMYTAMKNFDLRDKKGFVVGSLEPWVEIYALLNGAKHVLTVEYNKLEIQEEFKDRMEAILPIDFARNWEKYAGTFDFAASFSSIEHSGIGRYGDPIDPIGDLREMAKIKCMLKPGGLLFLAMPQGTDAIVFNLHRIYGPLRLAMMFTGFELIGAWFEDQEEPYYLNYTTLHGHPLFSHYQATLVLRKI